MSTQITPFRDDRGNLLVPLYIKRTFLYRYSHMVLAHHVPNKDECIWAHDRFIEGAFDPREL